MLVRCVPKNVHLFIFRLTLSKLTDSNDFWYASKIEHAHICLPHVSDIATLGNQNKSFTAVWGFNFPKKYSLKSVNFS